MSDSDDSGAESQVMNVPRLYQEEEVTDLCDRLEIPTKVQGDFVWGPDYEEIVEELGEDVLEALEQAGFQVCGYRRNEDGELEINPNSTSDRKGHIFHDTTQSHPDETFGTIDDLTV